MMNSTSPERVRQDSRLIRQTLLKLSSSRLVLRAVVIAVAAVIWLLVAQRILAFGATLDYQFLHPLGASTIELLNRINPYLWWAVALVWSLIVFFAVRGWLRANMEAARLRTVPADTFADLAGELSDEVIGVMRWSWGSRDEPFTVGDLQRTLWELRHGRIAKIAMVREQEALLGIPAVIPGRVDRGDTVARPDAARPDAARPDRGARAGVGRPDRAVPPGGELLGEHRRAVRAGVDADGPIEPRIGPIK